MLRFQERGLPASHPWLHRIISSPHARTQMNRNTTWDFCAQARYLVLNDGETVEFDLIKRFIFLAFLLIMTCGCKFLHREVQVYFCVFQALILRLIYKDLIGLKDVTTAWYHSQSKSKLEVISSPKVRLAYASFATCDVCQQESIHIETKVYCKAHCIILNCFAKQ